jgi:restriction endonuclease S subunit
LYPDEFYEICTPLPPILEQERIADFINREVSKIGALMKKVSEAIDHLKEYRTALISAAVTGKIEVQ